MTIDYYTKEVYGKTMLYLADRTQASLWERLTGKRTLTERDMATLTDLTMIQFNRVFGGNA